MDDDHDNPPCKLLVRALKVLKPNKIFELEFNFHLIDLKTKKIELNYIPAIPLLKGASIGRMAMVDSCIYILSGVLDRTELNRNKKKYEEDEVEDEVEDEDGVIHFHCKSSKYSLVSKRWDVFDVPAETNCSSVPATIFGKLYFFGGAPWRPPKVYENGWKDLELPSHLIHRKVSFPVIPDRKNNRYLVHFYDSGEIYAFHPNSTATATASGDWTCVSDNFYKRWSPLVAISGNIIFFHVFTEPCLITAYDMSTKKWLEIVPDFDRVDETLSLFNDMFILPQNHDVLCLAAGIVCNSDCNAAVVDILRLRFNHTDDGSNQLTLTALDYHSYDIPIRSRVFDFLLLL